MDPKSPETRERRPLRKAREESQARLQAILAEKEAFAASKNKAKGTENVAPKKRGKVEKKEEAADDEGSKPVKKNVKASAAAKSDSASSSTAATKEAEKKKKMGAKPKGKSKTDDDVVKEKPVRAVPRRRSKSLDSPHLNGAAESSSLPTKRARGKKVAEEESQAKPKAGKKAAPLAAVVEDEVEDVPKGRAAKKPADKKTDEVPAKKPRGKKAASKPAEAEKKPVDSKSEESDGREDDESKVPAKKSRSTKNQAAKAVAKQSSDDEVPEEKGQPKKSPKKAVKSSTKLQDETIPVGQAESSASDEEELLAKKPAGKGKKAKSIFDSEDEDLDEPEARAAALNKSANFDSTESKDGSEEPNDQPENSRKTKAAETKSVPEKRARKAPKQDSSGGSDDDKPTTSKAGKKLQNKVDTDYSGIDFDIKEKFNMKIVTWNVAGLKALANKNVDYFGKENADIICLNELKCTDENDVPEVFKIDGYSCHWNIAKGSGGVAVLSKVKPLNVTYDLENTDFADAHRLITVEYEKFFLVSTYVVNSGRGLKTLDSRLEWNKAFDAHVCKLDKKKPVIITGDMNVSHQEIDLANPKTNKKNAGFTQEERDGFTKLLSHGFVDTFRHFHPDQVGAYTFWTYMNNARSKNVGWRLDYFLVSARYMKHVKANVIRSYVLGSDHCPIVLFLNV